MTVHAGQRLSAAMLNKFELQTYTSGMITGSTSTASATYVQTGTAVGTQFVAPESGKVRIDYGATISSNNAGNSAFGNIEVREGGTVGSGNVVLAAGDDNGGPPVRYDGVSDVMSHSHYILTGLTPDDTYNVRILFRGDGTDLCEVNRRIITVKQLPI